MLSAEMQTRLPGAEKPRLKNTSDLPIKRMKLVAIDKIRIEWNQLGMDTYGKLVLVDATAMP